MLNDSNASTSKVKIFMEYKQFWHELDLSVHHILTVSFQHKPDEQCHHYNEDQQTQRDDEAL